MSLNKVMLIGNLGKDPEVKYTQSQMAICNFSLATTEKKKGADGQWVDQTEWHNVVCFGKTAENVSLYLRKGGSAYIEGSIKTRKWQDKEGKDRWSTEVVANQVQFLGKKSDNDSGPKREPRESVDTTGLEGMPDVQQDFDDSSIPF